jgi:hypothetical protein
LGGLVLVAVVVLIAKGLSGGSSGASSPEAAVRQLANGIQRADMVAAIAVIDPDETGTLADLYESVDHDLSGTGGGGSHPSGGGHEGGLEVRGLEMSEERMGPGVVKVVLDGGTVSGSVSSYLLAGLLHSEPDVEVEFASASGPAGQGNYVITREVDGHWYVSPTMTALSYLVDRKALSAPDFGGGMGSPGSAKRLKNGSKLMSTLAQAVDDRDATELLGLVSNEEASGVRPYVAALQELIGEVEGSAEIQVTDSDFSEHDLGSGLVRLDLTHAALDAYVSDGYEGSQASVKLNGFCVNVLSSGGYSSDSCDTKVRRLFGVSSFFVVARREDGGLRLAPVATLLEYVRLLFDNLSVEGVQRAAGAIGEGAGADLASTGSATGKLNAGGYAVLPYTASGPGLVAVEADQYVTLLDPDGHTVEPLTCAGEVEVYSLDEAGAYGVVVASGDYRPGAYSVAAESVRPQSTGLSSEVSGTIGDGVRLSAYSLDFSGYREELIFETGAAVSSEIVDSYTRDSSCPTHYDGTVDQIIGPESLFSPLPAFDTYTPPSRGEGNAVGYGVDGGSSPYLFVSGSPGTSFSGTFSAGTY